MSESDDAEMRSIATRISQLNQIFLGRATHISSQALAGRESLLDALFALYDECNNTHFMRNQYIASFVNKCKMISMMIKYVCLFVHVPLSVSLLSLMHGESLTEFSTCICVPCYVD